jgi:hypothetical protein
MADKKVPADAGTATSVPDRDAVYQEIVDAMDEAAGCCPAVGKYFCPFARRHDGDEDREPLLRTLRSAVDGPADSMKGAARADLAAGAVASPGLVVTPVVARRVAALLSDLVAGLFALATEHETGDLLAQRQREIRATLHALERCACGETEEAERAVAEEADACRINRDLKAAIAAPADAVTLAAIRVAVSDALVEPDEDPECVRCHATICINVGDEPTPLCHHCAQAVLAEVVDLLRACEPRPATGSSQEGPSR